VNSRSEGFRIGAYIRLSPSDEIREEGSLVSHPQRIKQFVDYRNAQSTNWGSILDWYTDKDYSGKDMNRPEFKRMCRDIKDGKINAVIVTELSRLSRSVKDFCQFWDFLKRYKPLFIVLKKALTLQLLWES
jgi:site-specific DNA recombinase